MVCTDRSQVSPSVFAWFRQWASPSCAAAGVDDGKAPVGAAAVLGGLLALPGERERVLVLPSCRPRRGPQGSMTTTLLSCWMPATAVGHCLDRGCRSPSATGGETVPSPSPGVPIKAGRGLVVARAGSRAEPPKEGRDSSSGCEGAGIIQHGGLRVESLVRNHGDGGRGSSTRVPRSEFPMVELRPSWHLHQEASLAPGVRCLTSGHLSSPDYLLAFCS